MSPSPKAKRRVGWREWVALPQLGVPAIRAKMDTGARTSALHAFAVKPFRERGALRVRFGLHPLRKRTDIEIYCEADVVDRRMVSDSGGHRERRYVILTELVVGDRSWDVEVTLANRETMRFRMLIGRTAMINYLLIDAARSYTLGHGLANAYPPQPDPKGKLP